MQETDRAKELTQVAESRLRIWLIRLLAFTLIASLLFLLFFTGLRISGMPPLRVIRASYRLARTEHVTLASQSAVTVSAGSNRGSGFILPAGDLCLTCAHVLDQATEAVVTIGAKEVTAQVLAVEENLDLALLDLGQKEAPGLELADFLPRAQEELIMLGSPFGASRLISSMEYAGLARLDTYERPLLAVKGPVYKGHSGSPLLNEAGQVVGMLFATAGSPDDQSLGLLISFTEIKEFLSLAVGP